ncbi:hypothetical protein [Niabella hibiscisoli]|uniref:hypothetical protein n=1 Tax=Niabella hibiscisoli TaxID=1825928 RepID=UPI001F0FC38D|nr:hypothetical protein [Niabella hibiscisoli]MCH5718081.1 hypothetical protein [Niabella hibiscisoli]
MMKKVYLILGLFIVVAATSCGNGDTTEETTSEQSQNSESATEVAPDNAGNDAAVIESFAKDKSAISTADIDPKDTSFTTRSKTLYLSDENGKKLAVVYGFKAKPNGMAIIEVEGEKAVSLKQVETAPGAPYEFTNGTIILKRLDKTVQLNENGEVVTYKEIR